MIAMQKRKAGQKIPWSNLTDDQQGTMADAWRACEPFMDMPRDRWPVHIAYVRDLMFCVTVGFFPDLATNAHHCRRMVAVWRRQKLSVEDAAPWQVLVRDLVSILEPDMKGGEA